jgi:membrane associated rhomboid family serine protease
MDDQQPGVGPWGERTPAHEPVFNAPWPSVLIVAAIIGSYAWQVLMGGGEKAALMWGFAPADLLHGRWVQLLTMMFIHGGWTHAVMNALGALAFGPPVARLLGSDAKGAAAFLGFYLVCGVLASLGYAAVHPKDVEPVIGASGAVSGLMGAATRLFGRDPAAAPGDALAPIWSRQVLSLGGGWAAANLLLAVTGASPLMPGAKIAWEAHIAGLVAGLLLIGPFAQLLRGKSSR